MLLQVQRDARGAQWREPQLLREGSPTNAEGCLKDTGGKAVKGAVATIPSSDVLKINRVTEMVRDAEQPGGAYVDLTRIIRRGKSRGAFHLREESAVWPRTNRPF